MKGMYLLTAASIGGLLWVSVVHHVRAVPERAGTSISGSADGSVRRDADAQSAPAGSQVLTHDDAAPTPMLLSCSEIGHTRPGRRVSTRWETMSVEDKLAASEPIYEMLPHLDRGDLYKLDAFCPGDFNKDDAVDQRDLELFVTTWGDEASPIFAWADVNGDDIVDDADLTEFVRLMNEACEAQERQQYRLLVC